MIHAMTMTLALAAGLLGSLASSPAAAANAPLEVTVYNPGKEAIFPVTSTLISGPHELMLVDAQFQKQYAQELVKRIKATGKELKYIYISHSDPDFYFGLSEVQKAFPKARVVATAQTAYLISATKDAKLKVWSEKLGADAPEDLSVPTAVAAKELVIEGQNVEIRGNADDPAHSYLWIPSIRTVIASISVSTDEHLWMADSAAPGAIDKWLRVIGDMKSLAPERVIAGHFLKADQSPTQLDFVKHYLTAYKAAATENNSSAGLAAAMTREFPTLPGQETLELGAKVFTGEADWHVAHAYPPIGKVAIVDFGKAKFRLNFLDNRTMSFEDASGAFQGVKDTVQYTAVEVSPSVFMVYWHEPSTGANVVHVQNWNLGTVYTNIAGKDGSFLHLSGTIALQ